MSTCLVICQHYSMGTEKIQEEIERVPWWWTLCPLYPCRPAHRKRVRTLLSVMHNKLHVTCLHAWDLYCHTGYHWACQVLSSKQLELCLTWHKTKSKIWRRWNQSRNGIECPYIYYELLMVWYHVTRNLQGVGGVQDYNLQQNWNCLCCRCPIMYLCHCKGVDEPVFL